MVRRLCRGFVPDTRATRRGRAPARPDPPPGGSEGRLTSGSAPPRPTGTHVHLAKLFDERLETIDPGFGIEEIVLIASRPSLSSRSRRSQAGIEAEDEAVDMSQLVDRLTARIGADRVYRLAPVEIPRARAHDKEGFPRSRRRRDPPGRRTCRGRRAFSIRRSRS